MKPPHINTLCASARILPSSLPTPLWDPTLADPVLFRAYELTGVFPCTTGAGVRELLPILLTLTQDSPENGPHRCQTS
jgi:hypothetical protein